MTRVSVFAGEFGLEAAEEICSGGQISSYGILNLISSLVDKSLIQVEETSGEARFRLLETVRAFARDKLTHSKEAAEVRNRHLDYYVALSERAGQEMRDRGFANVTEAVGGEQTLGQVLASADFSPLSVQVDLDVQGRGFADWFDRLSAETDNLRAAMDWALASGQADKHLQISGSLLIFWNHRGLFNEMHVSMEAALATASEPPVRAKALATASGLSVMAGHFRLAAERAKECVDLSRELGDETSLAYGLSYWGWSQFWMGEGGLDKVKEAQRTAQAIEEWRLLGISFFFRTLMEAYLNNARSARPFLDAAITGIRMSREPFSLAVATYWGAGIYMLLGELAEA
ncbi:MAG: ATP-binding protein, partial [Acidimicrobiia bacterium]